MQVVTNCLHHLSLCLPSWSLSQGVMRKTREITKKAGMTFNGGGLIINIQRKSEKLLKQEHLFTKQTVAI